MSVKTRDRRNSLNSTNTDASDLQGKFQMKPSHLKSDQTREDEPMPQNDFYKPTKDGNSNSYFGQSKSDGVSFRPESSTQVASQFQNHRTYSFAPFQVKEESECSYSLHSDHPKDRQDFQKENHYYPQKPDMQHPYLQQRQDPQHYNRTKSSVDSFMMPQNKQNLNNNQPPIYQGNFTDFKSIQSLPFLQGYDDHQQQYPQFNRSMNPMNPPQYQQGMQHQQVPQTLLQCDILPQEVLFLLAEEDNLITKYRAKVEREKQRVEKDVDLFKNEVVNLIEDLKMQMQQFIDDHYKRYISVFCAFKEEIIQWKAQKLEGPLHLAPPPLKQDMTTVSNSNLIRELEELQYQQQLAKINQYFGEVTKSRTARIAEISKDLLHITSSGTNFYNSENTVRSLNQLRSEINTQLISKFATFDEYIQPLDYLLNNGQSMPTTFRTTSVNSDLNEFVRNEPPNKRNPQQEQHHQSFDSSSQKQHSFLSHPNQNQQPKLNKNTLQSNIQQTQTPQPQHIPQPPQPQHIPQPPNNIEQLQQKPGQMFSTPFPLQDKKVQELSQQAAIYKQQSIVPVSQARKSSPSQLTSDPSHCVETTKLKDSLTLLPIGQISLTHNQMPLCLIHIKENLIATGSKDGMVKIWDNNREICEFKEHIGGVCCMTVIRQQGVPIYLASGSDHGDNSVIVWSLQTFLKINSLQSHSAAVVSLLSLDDGQTLVSASYDKSICIWNVECENKQVLQKLTQNHTNAVTCLCLTSDKQRIISGGLDSLINVWKVNYKSEGKFESCYLEKTIKNGSIVCSLLTLTLGTQGMAIISGGKDGRLRDWDLFTGNLNHEVTASVAPIVEIISFSNGEDCKILTMSTKDKNLILSDLRTGENEVIDMKDSVTVEYGCGVYPKMQMIGNDKLLLLSQNEINQNIAKYELRWQ